MELSFGGELLEHIDNPVAFLSSIRENYKDKVERIIITVPNAFNIKEIIKVFAGKEAINTDHRYWFTPYTILKVFVCAGIEIEDIYFTGYINQRKYKILNALLAKPIMCKSLVVVGKLS